jgi:hypothetical protein
LYTLKRILKVGIEWRIEWRQSRFFVIRINGIGQQLPFRISEIIRPVRVGMTYVRACRRAKRPRPYLSERDRSSNLISLAYLIGKFFGWESWKPRFQPPRPSKKGRHRGRSRMKAFAKRKRKGMTGRQPCPSSSISIFVDVAHRLNPDSRRLASHIF